MQSYFAFFEVCFLRFDFEDCSSGAQQKYPPKNPYSHLPVFRRLELGHVNEHVRCGRVEISRFLEVCFETADGSKKRRFVLMPNDLRDP